MLQVANSSSIIKYRRGCLSQVAWHSFRACRFVRVVFNGCATQLVGKYLRRSCSFGTSVHVVTRRPRLHLITQHLSESAIESVRTTGMTSPGLIAEDPTSMFSLKPVRTSYDFLLHTQSTTAGAMPTFSRISACHPTVSRAVNWHRKSYRGSEARN